MLTSSSQLDKALHSLFTHMHGMRTDRQLLESAKVNGKREVKVGVVQAKLSFQTLCRLSPVHSRTASVLYTASAGVNVMTNI